MTYIYIYIYIHTDYIIQYIYLVCSCVGPPERAALHVQFVLLVLQKLLVLLEQFAGWITPRAVDTMMMTILPNVVLHVWTSSVFCSLATHIMREQGWRCVYIYIYINISYVYGRFPDRVYTKMVAERKLKKAYPTVRKNIGVNRKKTYPLACVLRRGMLKGMLTPCVRIASDPPCFRVCLPPLLRGNLKCILPSPTSCLRGTSPQGAG